MLISKNHYFRLNLFKLFIDSGVILIAGVALWTNFISIKRAKEANQNSKEAIGAVLETNRIAKENLITMNIPWLQLNEITVKAKNKSELIFSFIVKNYATSPALDVKVSLLFGNGEETTSVTRGPAIMPKDTQVAWTTLEVSPRSDLFLERLKSGGLEFPVLFRIRYKDVLGNDHQTDIKCAWSRDGFQREEYKVLS